MGAHFFESGALQQRPILFQRALLSFGADQHVERLHMRARGSALVRGQYFLGDEEAASSRQRVEYFAQEAPDLLLRPVVQNASHGVEIGGGPGSGEKTASH